VERDSERAVSEPQLQPSVDNRFLGMHADANAKLGQGFVLLAQNMHLDDGAYVGRHGVELLGSQIKAGGTVQGCTSFEDLQAAIHTVAFVDGDMYEYDWSTDSWGAGTDLSSEGVSMDPAAIPDFVNYRGRLIVTDGVNTPWMWNPSTGDFTVLTEAPIARQASVYYDKIFFSDLPGDPSAFEWSEEGFPDQGYDGASKAWTFAQTDQGRIRRAQGMNEALLVMKEDSTSVVRGAVDDEFKTDAVREGVSETEGTIAGHSVVVVDGDLYMLSQGGPRRIAGAMGAPQEINFHPQSGDDRLADIWSQVDRDHWSRCVGVYVQPLRHIVWFVPTSGSALDLGIVYSVDDGSWSTMTLPFDVVSVDEVENTDGEEFVMLGDGDGKVYLYGGDARWDDNGVAVDRVLRSREYGKEQAQAVKRGRRLELGLNLVTDLDATLVSRSEGADGTSKALSFTGVSGYHKYTRGLNVVGRSIGWELRHETVAQTVRVEDTAWFMSFVDDGPRGGV
jgi:hypothetical protein